MNPFSALTAVLAAAVVALAAGLWLGGHPNSLPDGLRDVFVDDEQALHSEVREAILDNFYREVPGERLDRASLTGMVRSLDDPFSHYLPPADFTALQRRLQGQFEGVGMGVDQDKRGLLVVHVFDDSPAQRAGIHKGDVITEVNGESIAGESSDVSTAKIRGRPGTKVRLTVFTPRPERTRELTLERARIQVPIVDSELRGAGAQRVGVVRLAEFSNGSHGKLREEIERVRKSGAKGLVLDLRGNGGGVLDEAVLVGSIFIEDGLVVSTRGRTRDERRFNALGDAIDAKLPVVVLVDRGSASASEIVTGALRDRHRATVVGERTYGKGVFQEVKRLSNGGALDITVGSYYLPRGENITKRGIQPQVRARDNPRTRRDEAMPVALEALRDRIR